MITDATLTQNLDSKARNLEIRTNVLTKFLWEQKQAAEATSPPAKAPVGGTGIPPSKGGSLRGTSKKNPISDF